MSRSYVWLLLLVLLLGYWAISLSNLTVLPLVYEDEPWQISTGWKLATQGIFGSDMFAGYLGRDQHYYGYMPLYPIGLAAVFRIAGLGLEQARYVNVACGLLILALTYRLAQRLWRDWRIGILALAMLLFVRGFGLSPLHPTGILFLDAVRIARYDVMVPFWGLVALHLYLTASARNRAWWYFLAGAASALAGLAHVYGSFFLLVLVILFAWDRPANWKRALAATVAGFIIPFLFYAGYVLQDVGAWRSELRAYSDRFGVLDWQWYAQNLATEWQRYGVGIGNWQEAIARPGLVVMVVGLGVALVALGRRAFLLRDRNARIVIVPLVLFPVLFALLIRLKFTNYLFVVTPFAALAVAWVGIQFWDWAGRDSRRVWVRGVAGLVAIVILVEGVGQLAARENRALATTPYEAFIARVRDPIPEHTRVLGLQNYGLGWERYEFRSLAIPFLVSNPQLEDQPLTIEQGMDAQAPDYILFDDRMRKFFADADPAVRTEFAHWMETRGAVEIARVHDASYGVIEIYRIGD